MSLISSWVDSMGLALVQSMRPRSGFSIRADGSLANETDLLVQLVEHLTGGTVASPMVEESFVMDFSHNTDSKGQPMLNPGLVDEAQILESLGLSQGQVTKLEMIVVGGQATYDIANASGASSRTVIHSTGGRQPYPLDPLYSFSITTSGLASGAPSENSRLIVAGVVQGPVA